mmetsp:Transcript_50043/g.128805  ORF Transcript_50043/g.128805 Transcript_50043/m.128805 type:complete len:278 (-) Transcript_50043:217-1050(-)
MLGRSKLCVELAEKLGYGIDVLLVTGAKGAGKKTLISKIAQKNAVLRLKPEGKSGDLPEFGPDAIINGVHQEKDRNITIVTIEKQACFRSAVDKIIAAGIPFAHVHVGEVREGDIAEWGAKKGMNESAIKMAYTHFGGHIGDWNAALSNGAAPSNERAIMQVVEEKRKEIRSVLQQYHPNWRILDSLWRLRDVNFKIRLEDPFGEYVKAYFTEKELKFLIDVDLMSLTLGPPCRVRPSTSLTEYVMREEIQRYKADGFPLPWLRKTFSGVGPLHHYT